MKEEGKKKDWRRNVNTGGIKHSLETLIIIDEMYNL